MAENSKIEWTSHTFNPWRGCTKVSAGCAHCYAETLSGRNPKTLGVWGPNGTRVVAAESQWRLPLKWNKAAACSCGGGFRGTHSPYCPQADRPRVFCASLADVFEDWTGPMKNATGFDLWHLYPPSMTWASNPGDAQDKVLLTMNDARRRLFALIDATPNLDWLLLTKRPENVARMMPPFAEECGTNELTHEVMRRPAVRRNLWLGTSVENQAAADERIPHLLRTPAAVRFLSCEPLLSEVILHKYFARCQCGQGHGFTACPNTGGVAKTCERSKCQELLPLISWVIVGGESGPGARPCRVEWIRSLVQQCKDAAVACFVKQLGSNPEGDKHPPSTVDPETGMRTLNVMQVLRIRDRKGGDVDEWPADLRIREFPRPEGVGAVEGQQ